MKTEPLAERLQLLTLEEARQMLGASRNELTILIMLGKLRTFTLSVDRKTVRCVKVDVDSLLEQPIMRGE